MIDTWDNNLGVCEVLDEELENVKRIAGQKIQNLTSSDNSDVWLFPKPGKRHGDYIEQDVVFTLADKRITTGNIMGFIGYDKTEITIHSRFAPKYEKDYLMQYLLQKVFAVNIFDLKHSSDTENALDLAVLLFPYFLQKALSQGLYREYQRIEYNNDRVKGTIDFSRHIKSNFPFQDGKVSYATQEYRYDNPITQLIRHTIEHIKSRQHSSFILFSSPEIKSLVNTIINATPSYNRSARLKVLSQNLRPRIHPFYSEYLPLQRICIQILRNDRISYGKDSNRIHGVLFDGAWLWEQYLQLTLKSLGFKHPDNKKGTDAIHVFSDRGGYPRFPDYVLDDIIMADAKYKRLLNASDNGPKGAIPRDDLNQMITYLHLTRSNIGLFLCPYEEIDNTLFENTSGFSQFASSIRYRVGTIKGYGGEIHIIGVKIPQTCNDFDAFYAKMTESEHALFNLMRRVISGENMDKKYDWC